MVDKSKTLERDGKTICAEEESTLTDIRRQDNMADQTPLLSSGTIESIDALIEKLKAQAKRWTSSWGRRSLAPGSPQLARCCFWSASPAYREFKTPGFGVFGGIGIVALVIYFFGGYVSGLAGIEWVDGIFILGLALIALEIFPIPGTLIAGMCGAVCILVALVMGMTDVYPNLPWFPDTPAEGGAPPVEGIDFAIPDFPSR